MKSTYEALLSMAEELPTTIVWGNHDYKLWKKVKIPVQVTDSFVSNNTYLGLTHLKGQKHHIL